MASGILIRLYALENLKWYIWSQRSGIVYTLNQDI